MTPGESLLASLWKWDVMGFSKVGLTWPFSLDLRSWLSAYSEPTSCWMGVQGGPTEQQNKRLGCDLLRGGLAGLQNCQVISSGIAPSGSWEIVGFHTKENGMECLIWDMEIPLIVRL